jgi:hypothetical protein
MAERKTVSSFWAVWIVSAAASRAQTGSNAFRRATIEDATASASSPIVSRDRFTAAPSVRVAGRSRASGEVRFAGRCRASFSMSDFLIVKNLFFR